MNPYDVIILGGGPAGSSAATLLSRAGRRVVVLERENFPRFKIGESLLPYSTEQFDRLGIREKLDARFIIKHGAEINTSCGNHTLRFYFREGLEVSHPTAYQVTRSEFDKVMLEHAAEHGAEVREGTAVQKVEFDDEGGTVHLAGRETLRGRYILDATGRQSLIGNQFGLKKTYSHLKKFSVYAHFENVDREPGVNGTLIRLIRGSDRWFWMIPLTETRMSIGVVLDAATFRAAKLSPEAFLQQAIEEQPLITDRLSEAHRDSSVYAVGDYSYRNTKLTGNRWILAGDAAGFIDPVFSTGVFMGLVSGEDAADALDIALSTPHRAPREFARYEKKLNRVMDLYLRFVTAWYTPEFIEVFVNPERRLQLPRAINSVLAGNLGASWKIRWRMEVFYLLVWLQRHIRVVKRLDLTPGPSRFPRPEMAKRPVA